MIKGLFASFMNVHRESERLILEMFYQHVYQTAFYILQDRSIAQEILLTTFKKAFKHMHNVQNGEKLGSWLATIATRASIDHLRKTNGLPAEDTALDKDLSSRDNYLFTIETMVEEKFLRTCLQKKIDKLKPDQKQIMILKYQFDMDHDEIAHALDINITMVETIIHLAKLTLLMEALSQPDLQERGILAKDNKLSLDRMIREALGDHMNHCPFPPLSAAEAWEQLQEPEQLKFIPSLQFLLNGKQRGISAVLLLILGIGAVWASSSVLPLEQPTEEIAALPGERTTDHYEVISYSLNHAESLDLEKAREISDFLIRVPQSVPAEFNVSQVKAIRNPNEKIQEVYLIYQGEKRAFVIREQAIDEKTSLGTAVNLSDTEVLDIHIKGAKGTLFQYQNGVSRLVWMSDRHSFSIEGRLTQEEIISIAESI